MKTLKLDGKGKARIVEAPEPTPGSGQVVIQTRMSALCGSEMSRFRGAGMEKGNSGHEGIGKVIRLGEGVTRVKLGDRVGASAIAGCGRADCEYCRAGQSTWCPGRKFYGSMHAEQFLTAETACLPLPEDVPDDVGVLIAGDGLGVPYHTSVKLAAEDIHTIAVFGLGPIGLGSLLLQAWLGRRLIAVDLSPERLVLAGGLGAALTVNAAVQNPVEAIKAATEGRGADACIEAAGVPLTARQCFQAVRTAGWVAFNGEQKSIELSPSEDLIRRDVRAVGSWYFQVGEYPEMLRLYRDGLPVKSLATHVFPFERVQEAYDRFAAGVTGKVLLRYETR